MTDQTRSSLELMYSISRRLVSAIELDDVLRLVAQLAVENLGAERCTLVALDTRYTPVAVVFIRDGQLQDLDQSGIQAILQGGLAGWVVRHREPVLIDDTSRDERWLVRPDDRSSSTGAKSALCIPLTASDQLVGVMTIVHPQPNFFTHDHLDLLVAIAAQAGIAIYNALLFDSLQAAKARYRDLFDESVLPIFVTDLAGQVMEANHQACVLAGSSMQDLAGVEFSKLHIPEDAAVHDQIRQLAGEQTFTYEALFSPMGNGQKPLPVEVFVRPALVLGKPCLQWTLRDISERRALDLLRSDMVAMIYHDLRSPLANIISSLDMVDALVPSEIANSLKPVLSIANRSSNRMQRLINSLLDLHRLEAGQVVNRNGNVKVDELVQETVETVRLTAEGKHQSILVKLDGDLPSIYIDPDMVRRVLINLLENASKYSPVQSSLEIGASSDKDWVKLWVQDNGPGIPAEYRDYIFEKFARLQPDRYPKGVGLGLAFCQLAVQAHGGKIWVESLPGQGSRFVFTLPRKLTDPPPEKTGS